MAKKVKTAITPTREEDYPEWYQQVVKASDMAERSPVELGVRRPGSVEVTSGLRAGDRIVSAGTHKVTQGAKLSFDHGQASDESAGGGAT